MFGIDPLALMVEQQIAPFTCIAQCLFAEPRIDLHFIYPMILADLAIHANKTLVDVGCCTGTDIRTLIAHGYPAHVGHVKTVIIKIKG